MDRSVGRGVSAVPAVAEPGRDARRVPVRRLTVLYDAECALCTFLRDWLVRQPKLVPLEPVAAASQEARRRFPGLDHRATLDEITVVGDAGQVYRGAAAWIVTLWALREYRPLAHRLCTPSGVRFARGAVLAAAKWRGVQGGRTQRGGQAYRPGDEVWRPPGGGVERGGAERPVEGWAYDPRYGWMYSPPGCSGGRGATG
ncbi:thiol-disulfide oxidoreductase DCC family protein [Streptomyces camelliae]|uniref:DCC1-like thiol-disulfide oxidoreductase family protein n=1 Tax=Streptomyces camelliae TaxID=3004093 RepID=A0ABY7PE54_9ACTN|nr:DCC1-like thiol-disulfide oxidoreductase family protein [Streptomyces sp. HUAS 2-6]WBO68900.1 DCC1-like thiol-disulfide oxidoreductase family protein [Streptomyces sp. HUAS 2-6]